jgi:predicted nucleic acid-binding protein
MPTSARAKIALVDTSVAVALTVADHADRAVTVAAVAGRKLGLAGHAAFETFSVLTRLPAPNRATATAASRALRTNFPESRFLGPDAAAALLSTLPSLGLSGGGVYGALVAAAAHEHGLALLTRDRRAVPTYRALDVEFELVQ